MHPRAADYLLGVTMRRQLRVDQSINSSLCAHAWLVGRLSLRRMRSRVTLEANLRPQAKDGASLAGESLAY